MPHGHLEPVAAAESFLVPLYPVAGLFDGALLDLQPARPRPQMFEIIRDQRVQLFRIAEFDQAYLGLVVDFVAEHIRSIVLRRSGWGREQKNCPATCRRLQKYFTTNLLCIRFTMCYFLRTMRTPIV